MTQLEGLTILVDAARQMPESRHLARALKWGDHRIEVLRERKKKRQDARARRQEEEREFLARAASAHPEMFKRGGRCQRCGYPIENCLCEKMSAGILRDCRGPCANCS